MLFKNAICCSFMTLFVLMDFLSCSQKEDALPSNEIRSRRVAKFCNDNNQTIDDLLETKKEIGARAYNSVSRSLLTNDKDTGARKYLEKARRSAFEIENTHHRYGEMISICETYFELRNVKEIMNLISKIEFCQPKVKSEFASDVIVAFSKSVRSHLRFGKDKYEKRKSLLVKEALPQFAAHFSSKESIENESVFVQIVNSYLNFSEFREALLLAKERKGVFLIKVIQEYKISGLNAKALSAYLDKTKIDLGVELEKLSVEKQKAEKESASQIRGEDYSARTCMSSRKADRNVKGEKTETEYVDKAIEIRRKYMNGNLQESLNLVLSQDDYRIKADLLVLVLADCQVLPNATPEK